MQLALEFGLWLRLLRLFRLVLPPSPRLTRIVSETSRRSGIPVRAVWESTDAACQAVVFIATRTLVFTRPLVERLSDAEIASICQHELAHLTEPILIACLRIMRRFLLLPLLFAIPLAVRFKSPVVVVFLFAPAQIHTLVFSRAQRRMEQRADSLTVSATVDPAVYARALEKIHEANQIPAVLGGKRTHPDLFDRMVAAGAAPNYPRPARPKRFHWTSGLLLILVATTTVWLVQLL